MDSKTDACIRQPETRSPAGYPHFRRNFALGLTNGILMQFADSFVDPQTVLPVFVFTLTSSYVLAGLVSGLFEGGWFLPQVFISSVLQHRARKLPLYHAMVYVRVASWAGAALSILLVGSRNPGLLFALFFVCYLGVCLGAGIAGVPFMDVVGKSIPVGRRGSFFAYRRLVGGLLGVGAGVVVARVLSPESGLAFPYPYGILMCFTTVLALFGLGSFSFVKEPIEPVSPVPVSFREHLRTCRSILREDANYRRYYLQWTLSSFALMGLPFFATYAVTELHAAPAQVGVMVSLWMFSNTLSNLLWGTLSDRRGSRILIVISAALSGIAPVIALGSVLVPARPVAFPAPLAFLVPESLRTVDLRLLVFLSCFVLNGFAVAARKVSSNSYLLDLAPARQRATYIGLMNTISSPLSLAPALGGVITAATSYRVIFVLSLVFAVLSLRVSLGLAEARPSPSGERQAPCRPA